jgi:hypothetical protein
VRIRKRVLCESQRKRLMRHDTFQAAVALVGIGRIKRFQQRHFFIWRIAKIETAAGNRLPFGLCDFAAAKLAIQSGCCGQNRIANHLRFHPPRVHW